jgi:hypothetical protein
MNMDAISAGIIELERLALQQISLQIGKQMEKTFPEYKRMCKSDKKKVLTFARNLLVTASSLSTYVRVVSGEEPISWLVDTAKGAYLYGMLKVLKKVRSLSEEKINEIVCTATKSSLAFGIGKKSIMQDPENIQTTVNVIDTLGLFGDYIRKYPDFFFGILANMPDEVRNTWAKIAFESAFLKIMDEQESQIKQECYEN